MSKMDFYAPYPYPQAGRGYLYGAAAMNMRVKDAGGLNNLAANLVQIGFLASVQSNRKGRK